jgi:hypothetical protein
MRKQARIDLRTLRRLPPIENPPSADSPAGAFKAAIKVDGVEQWHFVEVKREGDETICIVSPIIRDTAKAKAE